MKNKKKIIIIAVTLVIAVAAIVAVCKLNNRNSDNIDDIGKVYFHETLPEHIALDDNRLMYADNEILVVVKTDTKEKDVKKLAEKYNAEIVGCIEATGDYQWLLDDVYSKAELESLTAEIQNEDMIESACLNYVFEVSEEESSVQYGQEWDDIEWSSVTVGGKNWGLEAIHAMEAWEYMDRMSPVRIGLIDGGFDAPNSAEQLVTPTGTAGGHEDIGFAMTFFNDVSNLNNSGKTSEINHGTHVAGIMAADSSDDVGICGAYPFTKDIMGNNLLYAVSLRGAESKYDNSYGSIMCQKCMYAELILRNVKVINCSWGYSNQVFDIELYNNKTVQEVYEQSADEFAYYLERFLDLGYDFVIVQAAGNESNRNTIKLSVDSDANPIIKNNMVTSDINGVPFIIFKGDQGWYYNNNGTACGINGFSESDLHYSGIMESTYHSLISVADVEKHPRIYNRIIVVGAYGHHDTITEQGTNQVYFTEQSISDFSNLGTRVDILAPGENIFSTTYSADGGSTDNKEQGVKSGDKYEFKSGTSMAAPYVSGVAAMVWSANSQLSGEEVKQIICENSDYLYESNGQVSELKYNRLLNAEKAVCAALGLWYDEVDGKEVLVVVLDDEEPKNGGILGYAVDSYSADIKLEGAKITAKSESGEIYTVAADKEGHFELILPEGAYTLTVECDGYDTYIGTDVYQIKPEEVITLQNNVELKCTDIPPIILAALDNENTWTPILSSSNAKFWFQDMNFDGQCELIVGGSSGLNDVYEYYYVFSEYEGGISGNQFGLGCYEGDELIKLVKDKTTDEYLYLNFDVLNYEIDDSMVYQLNEYRHMFLTTIAQKSVTDDTVYWLDGDYEKISESKYVKLYNSCVQNLIEYDYTTDVIMFSDYKSMTRDEKYKRLRESYYAFEIGDEIGTLPLLEEVPEYTGDYSEEELKAAAMGMGTIILWQYHDYDGNGAKEAFALVGADEYMANGLYFINSSCEVQLVKSSFNRADFMTGGAVECRGKYFFWAELSAGGPGSDTLLWSVRDDQPFELYLSCSENFIGFYEENGIYYTWETDALNGRNYYKVELIYDPDTQQFYKGQVINDNN